MNTHIKSKSIMNITIHHLRLSAFTVVGITSLVLASPHAEGQTTSWKDTTPGGADWHNAANWTAGIPTSSSTVQIQNGGKANITTTDAVTSLLYVGNTGAGSIDIASGGVLTSSSHSYLGYAGHSGTATVSGTWSANNLYVGRNAQGTLTIENGGIVTVAGTLQVGSDQAAGNGTLNLESGGRLDIGASNKMTLAYASGSQAVVNIKGGALNAASIETRAAGGTGTVIFNHGLGSYEFKNDNNTAIQILGKTQVNVEAGTTIFSAAYTYTGATTINAGTLRLSTTGSIASAQIGFGVTDSAAGLLEVENTSFAFSGTLSLNLSGVTSNSGSWTLFDGSAFGAGDLNLSSITNNLAGLTFVNNSGVWSGSDTLGRTWTFSEDLGQLSVVPEPATWMLLGVGVIAALVNRRRKR